MSQQSQQPPTGVISWFDIPTSNVEKAKTFYKEFLGWEYDNFEEGMHYWMIRAPKSSLPIGGLYETPTYPSSQLAPIVYFTVLSVDETLKKTKDLGCKVKTEKMAIPNDGGFFAHIQDFDNNTIGIWSMK